MTNERRPADNLLNMYLRQEGIDRRYSQLILRELHDATEMNHDQINRAANELFVPPEATQPSTTNANQSNRFINSKPNV